MITKLFNRDGDGDKELVNVLGLIDRDLEFTKWEPILPLATKELVSIIGPEPVTALDAYYRDDTKTQADADKDWDEALRLAQQAIAMFAWIKVIPTLDAQHSTAGRGKHLGENEHGMTAVQEFKDEENIRSMAYQAVDALVAEMEEQAFSWWTTSKKHQQLQTLLIRDKDTFDEFFVIGSHRLFLTLIPMIREVQDAYLVPILGYQRMSALLDGTSDLPANILPMVQRPLALLAMKRAVERLPIEVLPDGIVQVQQVGMVRDRMKAEQQARNSVAQNLSKDAEEFLNILTNAIQTIDAEAKLIDEPDYYVPQATVQKTGISF
jgi:hypothetical protein